MCPESIHYDATVEAFLTRAALPVADLRARAGLQRFEVRRGERLIGVVGMEARGAVGLLRSLAVEEAHRRGRRGRALVKQAESWAARHGVEALYLLTTTAAGFFARQGYQAIARSEAPAAIAGTPQFAGLCPASSTFMRKKLAADQVAGSDPEGVDARNFPERDPHR
jgi:amino-acid N-acetyltransferase